MKQLETLFNGCRVSGTALKVDNNTLFQVLMPPIPNMAMVTVADTGLVLVLRDNLALCGNQLAKSSNLVSTKAEMPRILENCFLVGHFV